MDVNVRVLSSLMQPVISAGQRQSLFIQQVLNQYWSPISMSKAQELFLTEINSLIE